jgi:hypothetical protein
MLLFLYKVGLSLAVVARVMLAFLVYATWQVLSSAAKDAQLLYAAPSHWVCTNIGTQLLYAAPSHRVRTFKLNKTVTLRLCGDKSACILGYLPVRALTSVPLPQWQGSQAAHMVVRNHEGAVSVYRTKSCFWPR